MELEKNVEIFLKQTSRFEKPLLLGFSGGPDSLALAYSLLRLEVPFHLAHYDHGWRETSAEEATELHRWASSLQIPFHTARSKAPKKTELAGRKQRIAFFLELFQSHEFEALVLAHHQNDQVETILKRVLEGAHLTNLKGIQPITYRGEMPVWRPFLSISKETIFDYLQEHKLSYIEDETNSDLKYLRARMRNVLLPKLAKDFGKEVAPSLLRLGKQSGLLQEYLDQQTMKYIPIEGPFGKMWDFSHAHPVEVEHVLSRFFTLSRPILTQITKAIDAKATNHIVQCGGKILIVDRQKIFWIENHPPQFTQKIPLKPGIIQSEDWEWEIQLTRISHQTLGKFGTSVSSIDPTNSLGKVYKPSLREFLESSKEQTVQPSCRAGEKCGLDAKETYPFQNWHSWWKGKISLTLPAGDYELTPPSPYFRKKWNATKVPAFLRKSLPTIHYNGKPVAEFLTEKREQSLAKHPLLVTIAINPRR